MFALAVLLAMVPSAVASPLVLDEVLESSARHFPTVAMALQRVEAQRGELLAAYGNFDVEFSNLSRSRLSGFYDGRSTGNKVRRPLQRIGGELYGSYAVSGGSFPIYEDELITRSLGQAKVGVAVSLLRDREIDERRRALADGAANVAVAEQDLLATRISVQSRAMRSYFQWLARGQQADIYQQLLVIARERDQALQRRVAEGDAAEILLTENRENLLRREVLLVEAEQAFLDAAAQLSLFWRDASGAMQLASTDRLGASFPEPQPADADALVEANLAALRQRPEFAVLAQRQTLARNELAIAENALKPRLDAFYEIGNHFGSGNVTREGTDNIVGFSVSVPLERRFARGKIARAQAELAALGHERRLLQDQLEVELRTIANALSASARQVSLAEQEVEQARMMEAAEQRRFESGASDFFLVNLREERTANARIRVLDAHFTYASARAELLAATLALTSIGLSN